MTPGGLLYELAGRLLEPITGMEPGIRRRVDVARLLAEREIAKGPLMSLTLEQRLSLWRRGYTSRSGVLFDLLDGEYDEYLSDYRFELLDVLAGQWRFVIKNKLTMHLLSGSFEEHLPEFYGVLTDGELRREIPFTSTPPTALDADASDVLTQLDAALDAHEAIVLKPVYGHAGKGIYVCRPDPDGEGYVLNGDSATEEAFADLVTGLEEYLVSAFVEQADYAEALFPDSANTLRIVTLLDPETDEPFVSSAVHRIGTAETAPVDNWSQGGLSAEVQPDGTLSRAARWSETDRETRWHDTHPDSGAQIAGSRVPDWSTIEARVLELASAFPFLPRIGWDVVVTGDGEFVVLELNSHPGIETIQVHRPLLRDPRVRRFYEYHGCV